MVAMVKENTPIRPLKMQQVFPYAPPDNNPIHSNAGIALCQTMAKSTPSAPWNTYINHRDLVKNKN